ncbi:hypothetical protein PR048_004454 [Dryococelus australis]|uniref:Uncharacterized protein n=1 Tax=Dryococelus australis TaxID=614101 RepID=A0ABQ9I5I0_9NEOP|nr:hypothetical protein PR048_004454 [Dryococelus australis]
MKLHYIYTFELTAWKQCVCSVSLFKVSVQIVRYRQPHRWSSAEACWRRTRAKVSRAVSPSLVSRGVAYAIDLTWPRSRKSGCAMSGERGGHATGPSPYLSVGSGSVRRGAGQSQRRNEAGPRPAETTPSREHPNERSPRVPDCDRVILGGVVRHADLRTGRLQCHVHKVAYPPLHIATAIISHDYLLQAAKGSLLAVLPFGKYVTRRLLVNNSTKVLLTSDVISLAYVSAVRENPPTKGIVWHDSHVRQSGVTRPGIEPGSLRWEARQANRSVTVASSGDGREVGMGETEKSVRRGGVRGRLFHTGSRTWPITLQFQTVRRSRGYYFKRVDEEIEKDAPILNLHPGWYTSSYTRAYRKLYKNHLNKQAGGRPMDTARQGLVSRKSLYVSSGNRNFFMIRAKRYFGNCWKDEAVNVLDSRFNFRYVKANVDSGASQMDQCASREILRPAEVGASSKAARPEGDIVRRCPSEVIRIADSQVFIVCYGKCRDYRKECEIIQLVSHQGEPGSIPDRVTPGFLYAVLGPQMACSLNGNVKCTLANPGRVRATLQERGVVEVRPSNSRPTFGQGVDDQKTHPEVTSTRGTTCPWVAGLLVLIPIQAAIIHVRRRTRTTTYIHYTASGGPGGTSVRSDLSQWGGSTLVVKGRACMNRPQFPRYPKTAFLSAVRGGGAWPSNDREGAVLFMDRGSHPKKRFLTLRRVVLRSEDLEGAVLGRCGSTGWRGGGVAAKQVLQVLNRYQGAWSRALEATKLNSALEGDRASI